MIDWRDMAVSRAQASRRASQMPMERELVRGFHVLGRVAVGVVCLAFLMGLYLIG